MVRLYKSKLQLPAKVTKILEYHLKKGKVYDIIFSTLCEDCFDKCYICEEKGLKDPEIEHIIPHDDDPDLKLDWNNLLLACGRCNNIKLARYKNILNPLKCDPEEHIALSVDVMNNKIWQVHIESLKNDSSTLETVIVLDFVYNGGGTTIKTYGCEYVRKQLLENIRRFERYIRGYREEPDEGYDEDIREEINRSSAFAAFKRKIIRDDPKLSVEFADALK